jgi:ParB family chromosome partitioning protein
MSVKFRDVSTRSDIHKVDPRLIKVEKEFNPRDYSRPENQAHVANLKESIRAIGVKKPLTVRWCPKTESIFLVDGESRLNAVLALIAEGVEIDTVPSILETTNNPAERLVVALSSNYSKALSELEKGRAYKRLAAYGWAVDKIAQQLGVSKVAVTQGIALAEAPDDVQAMVTAGTVSPAAVRKALKESGDSATEVLKDAVAKAKSEGRAQVKIERTVKVDSKLTRIREIITNDYEDATEELTKAKLTEVLDSILAVFQ